MKFLKILYRLLVYLTSFTVFLWRFKKKKAGKKTLKMTSQLVIYRAFFFPPPPPPPPPPPHTHTHTHPISEKKNPVNQLIKKILALIRCKFYTDSGVFIVFFSYGLSRLETIVVTIFKHICLKIDSFLTKQTCIVAHIGSISLRQFFWVPTTHVSVEKKWIYRTRPLVKSVYQKWFSYFSTKTYVVGTQKNRLDETLLLSTQNIC